MANTVVEILRQNPPRIDPPGQHQRRERLRGGHGPHQTRPRRGRRAGPALQDGPDGRWALSMRFRLVDIGLGRRIHLTFHLVFVSFQERSVSAQKPFERSFRFSQAKFFLFSNSFWNFTDSSRILVVSFQRRLRLNHYRDMGQEVCSFPAARMLLIFSWEF